MVAQEKKRVFITLDVLVLHDLEHLSWMNKQTKSEFVSKLIKEKLKEMEPENGCRKGLRNGFDPVR